MYRNFASRYDILMKNADYEKRTEFICSLFSAYDRMPALLLDLACGTGEFSERFNRKGVSVIGVDISEDMLCIARDKSVKNGSDVLYLCQNATELDLYGTVDGAVCMLDSLNHITDRDDLKKAISRVSLFLEKDRLFIFDVNTAYKHNKVLADNSFVFEEEGFMCVWQNITENNVTDMKLDFFTENEKGGYSRSTEYITERAYTESEIKSVLDAANLEILAVLDDMTGTPATDKTERAVYVTRKK